MSVQVTLSANAGVAISIGPRRIWVDALHNRRSKPFSTLTPQLQKQMLSVEAFRHPDYILYTHCHPDHYSEELTDAALAIWPKAKVLSPEGKYGCFDGDAWCYTDESLKIRFFRLPHEGEQYRHVRHFGILICCDGQQILLPGDCAVASEELLKAVEPEKVDWMLLDFPWMTLKKGRNFLQQHFPQAKKILIHLPFAEDDRFGYRIAAEKAAALEENVHILQDPFESVLLE